MLICVVLFVYRYIMQNGNHMDQSCDKQQCLEQSFRFHQLCSTPRKLKQDRTYKFAASQWEEKMDECPKIEVMWKLNVVAPQFTWALIYQKQVVLQNDQCKVSSTT